MIKTKPAGPRPTANQKTKTSLEVKFPLSHFFCFQRTVNKNTSRVVPFWRRWTSWMKTLENAVG